MTFNRQRLSRYLVVSGLGCAALTALAGVACIRTDRDCSSPPPSESAIETDVKTTAARTMRPLGSGDLMVDKHGTIWRGEQPMGVWGVNGGEPANAAKLR